MMKSFTTPPPEFEMKAAHALEKEGYYLQDHQITALRDFEIQQLGENFPRLCLYHRTGAGKTITALSAMLQVGATKVRVLAPPVTQKAWKEWGQKLGVEVDVISHAKFRQKTYKVRRDQAMIVDEFHLLGGHTGQGWTKLDRMARGLQAPLLIASATPSYNDVERVYCVQHVLDPQSCKGGFLDFVYQHCETEPNPFGSMPKVLGFRQWATAEDYLAALPHVHYLEDELIKQVSITDIELGEVPFYESLDDYGLAYNVSNVPFLCASIMEERQVRRRFRVMGYDGKIRDEVLDKISELIGSVAGPVLIYADSAQIANALSLAFGEAQLPHYLVTGNMSTPQKNYAVSEFVAGKVDYLIGTSTMATGLDGVDKMCDHLLIVDDTFDASLRRQLLGRILPRGLDTDVSKKMFWRLTFPN
jgi:superfamily II DNA or RNA helicase